MCNMSCVWHTPKSHYKGRENPFFFFWTNSGRENLTRNNNTTPKPSVSILLSIKCKVKNTEKWMTLKLIMLHVMIDCHVTHSKTKLRVYNFRENIELQQGI